WNGANWSSTSEVFLGADNTTWSMSSGLPSGVNLLDGSYTVRSRATDNAGNVQTPGAGNTFTLDQTPPTLSSVSGPANGTYGVGQNLDFTAHYSENVTVGGTPRIALTIGASSKFATHVSGSGSANIVFRYTVASGDSDSDGIASASPIGL